MLKTTEAVSHTEKLIETISSEYIQKLFYFCLKKTGNTFEAEDLSSDIILNIIGELRKGTIPEYFSAWVWKIARNRYYTWSKNKNIHSEAVSGTDPSEYEIIDEYNVESELIHSEDIKSLRCELAFISREYREILVAYYIDDRKVRDIAEELNLPEGTIKTKLFNSRKILKESMNMAREFGVRSYKPEDVNFTASGNQPSGLPWRAVQRKLPKNILLQAHNNPSTIEELSIEIGIAMPYMEEEVQLLVDGELLAEVNGKYITNFFIVPKECQLEVYNAQCKTINEIRAVVAEIIDDSLPEIKKLGIAGEHITDNELKWIIVPMFFDSLADSAEKKYGTRTEYKRKDGGNWGFTGYETHNLISEERFAWHNGNTSDIADFWKYSFPELKMGTVIRNLGYNHAPLFADIVKNKRNINSFSGREKSLWGDISERGYAHADKDGNIIFDVPVFSDGSKQKMFDILKSHAKHSKVQEAINSVLGEIKAILKKYSNPTIEDQLNYYVGSFTWDMRVITINREVEAKRLIVPETDTENTIIGSYVIVR